MKELLKRLLESREYTHGLHLQTNSYAQHKALEDFYENIVEHIDRLAEAYQGQFGIIDDYEIKERDIENDAIKYFENLAEFVREKRDNEFDEEIKHLIAIIDEIEILIYTTLYKLKYLN